MLKKYWKALPSQKELNDAFNYDETTGNLTRKYDVPNGGIRCKAGDVVGHKTIKGYINVKFKRNVYLAHRLIWIMNYGDLDINLEIDHINQNRSDNRLSNLRLVPCFINLRNKSKYKNNTSGFTGVRFLGKKERGDCWMASITIRDNGIRKLIHLGSFYSLEEAIEARKKAEEIYWS